MNLLAQLLPLIPGIISSIVAVENAFNGSKEGPAKKAVIMAAVGTQPVSEELKKGISEFIDATVPLLPATTKDAGAKH